MAEQARILREHFPELASGTYDENALQGAFPDWVEGPFALLRWQLLANTYGQALERVLGELSKTRGGKFINYRRGQLGPDWLRQTTKKVEAMDRIASRQEGHDILVVPAQFGICHHGRSVSQARKAMVTTEFVFGGLEVATMLLTHPERLRDFRDLSADCAGDEYSWNANGQFFRALCFSFSCGRLEFSARVVGSPFSYYGPVSGFSPQ